MDSSREDHTIASTNAASPLSTLSTEKTSNSFTPSTTVSASPSTTDSPAPFSARDKKLRSLQKRAAALEYTAGSLSAERARLAESLSSQLHPDAPERESTAGAGDGAGDGADGVGCRDSAVVMLAEAERQVKGHIKLLHRYNEIKDVGLGLAGLIADQRGVRVADVLEEFGMEGND